jgi:hypothetical protein
MVAAVVSAVTAASAMVFVVVVAPLAIAVMVAVAIPIMVLTPITVAVIHSVSTTVGISDERWNRKNGTRNCQDRDQCKLP